MPPRRRILQVSLDAETLTAVVNQLSKQLHKRDELEDIGRVGRGGKVHSFMLNQSFFAQTEVLVAPVLPGIPKRRIHVLGYECTHFKFPNASVAWLVETREDFVQGVTMSVINWKVTPEEAIAQNPTDTEGRKFVRVIGYIPSYYGGAFAPMPSQIGLLDPGHGVGLMATVSSSTTDWYQGILKYRELLANMT